MKQFIFKYKTQFESGHCVILESNKKVAEERCRKLFGTLSDNVTLKYINDFNSDQPIIIID